MSLPLGLEQEKLFPSFLPGCRRMTPGDGYLEALVKDNVECVFQGIDKIVPEGLITSDDKQLHEVDILICATGVSYYDLPPHMPYEQLLKGYAMMEV